MKLKKEIELLLYWYVPVFIFAGASTSVISVYIKSFNGESIFITSIFVFITLIVGHLDNIVIAIWLYFLAKKLNQKYILWSLFGLISNLFGAILFIILYLYEKHYPNKY